MPEMDCNKVVGAPGFEPGTSCSQSRRATRLRHAPNPTGRTERTSVYSGRSPRVRHD